MLSAWRIFTIYCLYNARSKKNLQEFVIKIFMIFGEYRFYCHPSEFASFQVSVLRKYAEKWNKWMWVKMWVFKVPMKLWNLKIPTVTWPYEYGHTQKEDPSAWIWMVSYSVNSVRGWFICLLILSLGAVFSLYFISVSFAPTILDPWEHFPLSYWAHTASYAIGTGGWVIWE